MFIIAYLTGIVDLTWVLRFGIAHAEDVRSILLKMFVSVYVYAKPFQYNNTRE